MKTGILLLALFCTAGAGVSDTLTVTGSRIPRTFPELTRSVTVIASRELDALPVNSVAGIFDLAAGADLKRRGAWGIQADLSLRGSTFEQVLVLVDGVRANDPQTGHHTLDLPVDLQTVERVEVLHGPGSSVYGPDAFGGVVNIVTKNASGGRLSGSLRAAGFNTLAGSGVWRFSKGPVGNAFSATGKRSDGYRAGTDFVHAGFHNKTLWRHGKGLTVLHAAGQRKEFGADRFYSTAITDDREGTGTWTGRLRHEHTLSGAWGVTADAGYRRHDDRYQYRWGTAAFADTHATGTGIAEVTARGDFGPAGKAALGGGLYHDHIVSTNMGTHRQRRLALYGEYAALVGGRLGIDAGLRWDAHTGWGNVLSPSVSLGWWPRPDLKVRLTGARAFRAPTFTELYYLTPGNAGNSALRPERCHAFEAGLDWLPRKTVSAGLTVFYRDQYDVIDWIKYDIADAQWLARNTGDADVRGVEFSGRTSWKRAAVRGSYGFTAVEEGTGGYISKYALRYAAHRVRLRTVFTAPLGLQPGIVCGYTVRKQEPGVLLLDARLASDLPAGMRIFVEGTNLLDVSYEEIPDVPRPGRLFGAGIEAGM